MGHDARMRLIVLVVVLVVLSILPASAGSARSGSATRAEAISWAKGQEGHRERGSTNCSSRISRWERDMDLDLPPCRPWCGAFVHQAFLRAGVKLSPRLIDPDRTYADARAGKRRLREISVSDVRPGDVLLFKFRNGHKATHMALATGRPRSGSIPTAEGNVGHTAVVSRRATNTVVLAARVDVD